MKHFSRFLTDFLQFTKKTDNKDDTLVLDLWIFELLWLQGKKHE